MMPDWDRALAVLENRRRWPMPPSAPSPCSGAENPVAKEIRRRAKRRLGQTLTAEERRKCYLLETGLLDLYRAEFGGEI